MYKEALPKEKDRWIRVDTDHFTLFSNASERQTKQLGRHVEKLKQALEATSTEMTTISPLPTYIFVFRNESTFHDYKLGRDGRSANLAGYFVRSDDGNYVAINVASGYRPEEIIFHEYVHYWLSNNVPDAPLWVSEGLSEYYTTFKTHANFADIGRYVESHLEWLGGHDLIPMRRMLAADTSSPDYHESDRVGTFYAQSWVAVHFLMSDPQRREQLGRYFSRIKAGQDPLAAFVEAWGMTTTQFQQQLQTYVAERKFPYYKLTFEHDLDVASATVQPIEYAEVLFRLGDLLAHNPPVQFSDAEQHLLAALKIDETLAPAWATLGYLAQLRGMDGKAAVMFEKALALDKDDARTHRLYGLSLLDRFEDTLVTGFETFDTAPAMLAKARHRLSRALELEPGHPPSLAGYAGTFAYEPHSNEALLALQRGIAALPGRTDLLLDLVIVTAHRGNLDGALELLERSLRSRGEASATRSAEALIAQVCTEQAFKLADADEQEKALQLLHETAEAIETGAIRRQLLAQATTIGATAIEGEDLERYDAAIDQANEGRFEEAIRQLDELIDSTDQAQLKLVAQAQRDSLVEIRRETENITLYNKAITLANDHKFAEALSALMELLKRELDQALRAEAETVKHQIDGILGQP